MTRAMVKRNLVRLNPRKSIPRYCLYCGMEKEECAKVRRQIHERCCPKCTHWSDKTSKMWRSLHKLGIENPMKRNLIKKHRNSRTIKETAGLGMALIASEHFFSSMLTSPMTTKRFFSTSPEGIKDTMDALKKAVGLSLVSGLILSWVSKSWTPLVTTGAVSTFYWYEYTNALKGEI